MKIRRREHTIPSLNLAAMPDLIFTVLFFFMIVTHMRNVTPLVRYEAPQGTELSRSAGKQPQLYIYVGENPTMKIQVNNRLVEPEQLAAAIEQEKRSFPVAERGSLTASLKADRHTPMELIMQIKQALRKAGISRISYSATQKKQKN